MTTSTQYPQQQPRRSFFKGTLVAGAIVVAFLAGQSGFKIEPFNPTIPPAAIVSTSAPSNQPFQLPTAAVAAPPVAAAVAASNVQVIPQGLRLPTAEPPTAVPTPVSPEVQAAYDLIVAGPDALTPIPMAACEAGKETFITTPVRVLNQQGMPIGEVRGRSCISDQEAHDNAAKLAQELMDKDKLSHPDAWK